MFNMHRQEDGEQLSGFGWSAQWRCGVALLTCAPRAAAANRHPVKVVTMGNQLGVAAAHKVVVVIMVVVVVVVVMVDCQQAPASGGGGDWGAATGGIHRLGGLRGLGGSWGDNRGCGGRLCLGRGWCDDGGSGGGLRGLGGGGCDRSCSSRLRALGGHWGGRCCTSVDGLGLGGLGGHRDGGNGHRCGGSWLGHMGSCGTCRGRVKCGSRRQLQAGQSRLLVRRGLLCWHMHAFRVPAEQVAGVK
jgi:hypothetical protein